MVGTFPQAWEEVALVTVELFNASAPVVLQAHAMTETVDISEPDYPGESIPNLAGGRVWKQSPQEDGEITLEFYPTNLAIDTDTTPDTFGGLFQFFASGQTIDSTSPTNPIETATTLYPGINLSRDRFRVSICWTNDTAITSAAGATSSADSVALRFAAMGCRMTSHKSSYTDGILKVTATFKFPAMSQDGTTKMYKWQSTNDGDTTPMTALTSYDSDSSWT